MSSIMMVWCSIHTWIGWGATDPSGFDPAEKLVKFVKKILFENSKKQITYSQNSGEKEIQSERRSSEAYQRRWKENRRGS
jgi:hypothetical protein